MRRERGWENANRIATPQSLRIPQHALRRAVDRFDVDDSLIETLAQDLGITDR